MLFFPKFLWHAGRTPQYKRSFSRGGVGGGASRFGVLLGDCHYSEFGQGEMESRSFYRFVFVCCIGSLLWCMIFCLLCPFFEAYVLCSVGYFIFIFFVKTNFPPSLCISKKLMDFESI
eukprot:GEMP01112701.1.p1 GENE.GEMP01112701.1~~GEMP01112701.1.p1  ORF type:complete len:118 (+),score=0.72 GEMP01112701.1:157-510(+)